MKTHIFYIKPRTQKDEILDSHFQFDLFFIQFEKSERDFKLPSSFNKAFGCKVPHVTHLKKKPRVFPLYMKLQLFHTGC